VRRRLPFVALLLVALWLPATAHCDLEASGLIAGSCHEEGDCAEACAADACAAVEGASLNTAALLRILAPAECSGLEAPLAVPALVADPGAHPRLDPALAALDRTWSFVRRAAPPARAPDVKA
jgi:hypothetical protein